MPATVSGSASAQTPVKSSKSKQKPAAPSGFSVIITGSKAILTWKSTAGATSYKVYYKKQGGVYNIITTKDIKLQISNLTKVAKYYFKVSAVNQAGEGKASSEISKTTGK